LFFVFCFLLLLCFASYHCHCHHHQRRKRKTYISSSLFYLIFLVLSCHKINSSFSSSSFGRGTLVKQNLKIRVLQGFHPSIKSWH
jgi:hypothetical protein